MVDNSDIRYALQDQQIFILYRLVPQPDGSTDKVPTCPLTGDNISPHDPENWMLPALAQKYVDEWGAGYGMGVVISEDVVLPNGRRLFCLDLDKCRDGEAWRPHAGAFLAQLPGCGVEVSVSFNGLHAWGTYSGERPDHGTRNRNYRMELYTRARFMAVTGCGAYGDPLKDLTKELHKLAHDYFPPGEFALDGELTKASVKEWSGPTDDNELVRLMIRSASPRAIFGAKARFRDLWENNVEALARAFPPQQHGAYDASAADIALSNHLAFWTGSYGERIQRLMLQSKLVREKWSRPGYLHTTIQNACGSQREWYKQSRYEPIAEAVVAPVISEAVPANVAKSADLATLAPTVQERTPAPGQTSTDPRDKFEIGSHLHIEEMRELFTGCTYVQDIHQILMPDGGALNSERFDSYFSGFTYTMTIQNDRPAKRAWEAFVFNERERFPKVKGLFFDPRRPPKDIRTREGAEEINSYVPLLIVKNSGDVSRYLSHLFKLFPNGNDAHIALSYFAACVQYPGYKFQWWPLIQGVEGNGKTTLSYFLEYAIGERYTHWPKAAQLGNRFNSAFYAKLLVCCEDVYISEAKGSMWEALKPMITGEKLEIEAKGVDQVSRTVCFNGVMNSNHKTALRKTRNDRRICPLFCAQQNVEDLDRDGMGEAYMNELRAWYLGEGRPIVADFLGNYSIPPEWNPAGRCNRAPLTSATQEAITAGMGVAEQEVVEAIGQGQEGFKGDWVSSTALDLLLTRLGKAGAVPRNRRQALMNDLGYMPHPGLPEGRAQIAGTDGTRPYLFVLKECPAAKLIGEEVMKGYLEAQATT